MYIILLLHDIIGTIILNYAVRYDKSLNCQKYKTNQDYKFIHIHL